MDHCGIDLVWSKCKYVLPVLSYILATSSYFDKDTCVTKHNHEARNENTKNKQKLFRRSTIFFKDCAREGWWVKSKLSPNFKERRD